MSNMDEDIACIITFLILCIILAGLIVFPICYCKNKSIELEKYKIEMQLKHGDIPINEVSE